MTGTLELLCGPSGVGKSSSLNDAIKNPMTYTTRSPRNEKDAKTRRFVDDFTFEKLRHTGEIVIAYEFDNHKYGFSREIIDFLQQGRNVSEQVGPHDAAIQIAEVFKPHGEVKKVLVLSNLEDIRLRLQEDRNPQEYERRWSLVKENIEGYLSNLFRFDEFVYNFPKKLLLNDVEQIRKNIKIIESADMNEVQVNGRIEKIVEEWIARDIPKYLGHPRMSMHMRSIMLKQIMREVKEDEKDIEPLLLELGKNQDTFKEVYAVSAILRELGAHDIARRYRIKVMSTLKDDGLERAIVDQDPVVRMTAKRILEDTQNIVDTLKDFKDRPLSRLLIKLYPKIANHAKPAYSLDFLGLMTDMNEFSIYHDFVDNRQEDVWMNDFIRYYTEILDNFKGEMYTNIFNLRSKIGLQTLRKDPKIQLLIDSHIQTKKIMSDILDRYIAEKLTEEDIVHLKLQEFQTPIIMTDFADANNQLLWAYSVYGKKINNQRSNEYLGHIIGQGIKLLEKRECSYGKYFAYVLSQLVGNLARLRFDDRPYWKNREVYPDIKNAQDVVNCLAIEIPTQQESLASIRRDYEIFSRGSK